MGKRYIFLMVLTTLLTGCQSPSGPVEESPLNPAVIIEDSQTAPPSMELSTPNNTGGNFSHSDLIYFIMIDRFKDGDESNNDFPDVDKNDLTKFQGGDFKGITEELDYIKSLGATAIWLTPVLKNEPNGYHGYWTYDFYDIDPHFGTMEELKHLVDEAHKKDIKVLLDHIVNHTGYNHPWLDDPNKTDWFHPKIEITTWNDQEKIENGWLSGLPDLDQDNPQVSQYLIDNTLWWIEQTGVDGMRLDTMRHVPRDFWLKFATAVKDKYPDFYLLGEVWNSNPRYLELYHEAGIDAMTNYSLFDGIVGTFKKFGKTGPLISALSKESNYTNPEINGIFFDNHDNQRFMTQAGEHADMYLKQALTFIMTHKAIPIIYYGTEIAMEGGNDPDNRKFMEWEKTQDSQMLLFYQTLVDLRQNNDSIKSGDFKLLDYDDHFLSYIRYTDDQSLLIVMNIKNTEKEVQINIDHSAKHFKDILTNETYSPSDGILNLTLNPLDLLILESK